MSLAIALSVAGAPAALATRATTAPGNTIQVYFIFTDKKLYYGIYREGPGGSNDLYLGTPAERGDYAVFYVLNRGHKAHSLVFMKRKFTVKPGQKDHFARALLKPGFVPVRESVKPREGVPGRVPGLLKKAGRGAGHRFPAPGKPATSSLCACSSCAALGARRPTPLRAIRNRDNFDVLPRYLVVQSEEGGLST